MSRTRPSFVPAAQRSACALLALSVGAVLAQPTGLSVLHGGATMQQEGARTTVTTANGAGTRHSALDWRSFGVPGGHTVFFSQPDALSTSINRVLGGDPSAIHGTLGSNGRLVLVNPAGIAVGPGAVIDTAGFTASTLSMSAADAVAGRLRFALAGDDRLKDGDDDDDDEGGDGKHDDDDDDDDDGKYRPGRLQVAGQVLARQGDVVLIAPRVETAKGAVIRADGGDVLLAAGRRVELTGRGLEGIRLELRAPEDEVVNLGTLQGDSVGIFAGRLRHSGLIQARSAHVAGGKVVLGGVKKAEVEGVIEASRPDRGGIVLLAAEKLVLKGAARIDVSHLKGGGEIRVGGRFGGMDDRLPEAERIEVGRGVRLKADATLSGRGGTVAVRGKSELAFQGSVSARGAGGGSPGQMQLGVGEQELEVQSVLARMDAETAGAMRRLARLETPDAEPGNGYGKRSIVIDAVQCTVTR